MTARVGRVPVECGKCGRRLGWVAFVPTVPGAAVAEVAAVTVDDCGDLLWQVDHLEVTSSRTRLEVGDRPRFRCRCGADWRYTLDRIALLWHARRDTRTPITAGDG